MAKKKLQIENKFKIVRSGHKRITTITAKFRNPDNSMAAKKRFEIFIEGNSIQDVISKVEDQFNAALSPENYTYNFPLRKDEFIPDTKKELEDSICHVPGCLLPVIGAVHGKDCCKKHFSAFTRTKPIMSTRQGRNEKCKCGSGKKFKNCCGKPGSKAKHYHNSLYEQNHIK